MKKLYSLQGKIYIHIIFFLFLCLPFLSHAQGEWQWAKSYSGAEPEFSEGVNEIICSDFDAEGNVYVLGEFGSGAAIDQQHILFLSFLYSQYGTFLAKFSPSGEMLWKKVIRFSNGAAMGCWMKVQGERVYLLSNTLMSGGGMLYYLDTLVRYSDIAGEGGLPENPVLPFGLYGNLNCFVTFDLDGNKLDEHFFNHRNRVSSSSSGTPPRWLLAYEKAPFHVDRSGNVYILAKIDHSGNVEDPLTIRVDDEKTFEFYPLRAGGLGMNVQDWFLFKFSPDFDLLWYKQLVDHATGIDFSVTPYDTINGYNVNVRSMTFDEEDNLYICGELQLQANLFNSGTHDYPVQIFWDSTHHTTIYGWYASSDQSFIVKYDTSGNVQWCQQLHPKSDSGIVSGDRIVFNGFYGITISGNCVYLSGRSFDFGNQFDQIDTYVDNAMTIPIGRNPEQEDRGFFIRYNKETGEYISHGYVPAEQRGQNSGQLSVINNHVILPCRYLVSDASHVIASFRNDGVLMEILDTIVGTYNPGFLNNGNIIADESGKLFFYVKTGKGMDIGDFHFFSATRSMAVFALMEDVSLLTPYDETSIPTYNELSNKITIFPNPTHSVVNIRLENSTDNFQKAELFNISGQKLGEYTSQSIPVRFLPTGMYILRIYVNNQMYVQKFSKIN